MQTDSKARILNVDDDPSGRYVTSHILRKQGFEVLEAATGEEALRLLQENPDLIVLDVNLPDVSGLEVCRRIKADAATNGIPVLHLSATSVSQEDRAAGLDMGADAYLTEPIEPELLLATIQALLRARRAEKEARDAARRWQTTFDAIGHGVMLADREGRVLQANRAVSALLDKPAEELTGRHYTELLPALIEPPEGWPFERAHRSGRHETCEIQAGDRWYYLTADPLFDERGEFDGAVRTMVDITDRKRAEEEREWLVRQLEHGRGRLEEVLRQMPAGVMIAEAPSGELILKNEQVEAILRGPRRSAGASGQVDYQYFHPGGKACRAEELPLARSLTSGEVVTNEEIEVVRGDGTRITVMASAAPIRDHRGFIVAGVATLYDVTGRRQLEEQVRESQKMEAIGRLAGGVAHDFNNLLTIIGGYGQMLLDTVDPSDPTHKDLEAIMEAADRAAALTRQLLTFSRRQIVQPRVLDLNRQVSRMNRMLRRVIGEDIQFSTVLKSHLSRVKADPGQIEQVLLNLAVNARDAMPDGGKLIIETSEVELGDDAEPRLRALKPGGYVMLAMSDSGTGIPPQAMSHIFEPFFTTKGKGKGTGLGLPAVYGIVKQSGGDIVVDSELGRGTTVRIYLPRVEKGLKAEAAAQVRPLRKGTETILLVEDEAEVRRLTSQMLSREGYVVIEAASGPEGLRLFQDHRDIDMLLTDVVMPQMSGRELAEKLREVCPALKVMYMSGYTDEVLARHGVLDPETAFVQKPFTLDTLARKLRSVLDGNN